MKKIIVTLLLLLLIGTANAKTRTFNQLIDEGYEIEHVVAIHQGTGMQLIMRYGKDYWLCLVDTRTKCQPIK
jgi:hypothetical protein